jgi:hypothetical protein
MGTEAHAAAAAGGQTETSDEWEKIDIDSLKVGVLRLAADVAEELGGLEASIAVEYLASGGYNDVWLLTYLPVRTLHPHSFVPVIGA